MYEAIVCKLSNIREHPNADRLKLATVQGYQIVVGLDAEEGTLGVFFPCDGKLEPKMLLENKLYAKHPETGEPMGGYFCPKGRVKAQKFRGEKSEGFWASIDSLKWTGDISKLKDGDTFQKVNGELICSKYYTPRAEGFRRDRKRSKKAEKKNYKMLLKHYKTLEVRAHSGKIPRGAILHISEKVHGTSGRTGHIKTNKRLGGFKRWLANFFPQLWDEKWEYVSGSRNATLDYNKKRTFTDGFYKTDFRHHHHEWVKLSGLHKGETVYYEIVGFETTGTPIMPPHVISDKKLKRIFGDNMVYKYGCEDKENKMFVYRITHTNEDGVQVDLSWPQVEARCKELGLKTVPHIETMVFESEEDLLKRLSRLAEGASLLDGSHIREGVVVRVEDSKMWIALKYKGWHFCEMEGIAKNSSEYIDPEEVV